MPRIIYITHDGAQTTVDVAAGMSVMRGAVANAVPGIDADCGGSCACGTCHVYVDPGWLGRLKAPAPMELDMLDMVGGRQDNSRLSCQIDVTSALDGLVVTTPATQG